MAITKTFIAEGENQSGSVNSITTSSVTLTAGKEYLIGVEFLKVVTPESVVVSSSGWTIVNNCGRSGDAGFMSATVLKRSGDGSTGTHTFAFDATVIAAVYQIIEFGGTANPFIVQTNTNQEASGISNTLSAFNDPVNNIAFQFGFSRTRGITIIDGTLIKDSDSEPLTQQIISQYYPGEELTPSMAAGTDNVSFAAEIAAEGVTPPGGGAQTIYNNIYTFFDPSNPSTFDFCGNALSLGSASPGIIAQGHIPSIIKNLTFIDPLNKYRYGSLSGKGLTGVAPGIPQNPKHESIINWRQAFEEILDVNNFPPIYTGLLFHSPRRGAPPIPQTPKHASIVNWQAAFYGMLDLINFDTMYTERTLHPSHGGSGPLPPPASVLQPGGFVGVGLPFS